MKQGCTIIDVSFELGEHEYAVLNERCTFQRIEEMRKHVGINWKAEFDGISSGYISFHLQDYSFVEPLKEFLEKWIFNMEYGR